ncbi:MAG: hypothetical protein EXS05_16775 [Planctomycetaceae bacterium]|nr:hypothetical protein [Planctomycetaceae bacterium]
MVNSPARLYLARGLSFGERRPDGTEQIRCVKVSLSEAVEMVMDSRITHGASCALILKALVFLERESSAAAGGGAFSPP